MPNAPYRKNRDSDSYVKGVGRRLAWLREAIGWTQTDLARMAGVDQSTWTKWEHGHRLASVSHIARLCDGIGVSLDYVFQGKIGGLLRRDLELALVARHPELVLGEEVTHAKVEVPAA